MELFFISFLVILFLLSLTKLLSNNRKKSRNQPPTPPSLPVIGHLHLIKQPLHRTLQHLSSKFGDVFALRFGSKPVLVVSSPAIVEECFTKYDVVLANKPKSPSSKYITYNYTTISSAPYGQLWRDLRRVATLELFSTTRLKAYSFIWQEEVRSLVNDLFHDTNQGGFTRIEMKSRIQNLSFNIILRVLTGKRFVGSTLDIKEANEFKSLLRETTELIVASNPGDYIPFLRWIDFQDLEKRLLKVQKGIDGFSQCLIDERRSKGRISYASERGAKTLIDAMISMQQTEPDYYTDDIIKGMILNMLFAGTDTTSVTIEWAISLLLNHPTELEKARSEIDEYIGQERLVEETDLPKLTYIHCIINETLRLFPAAPLLIPRESSEDCMIGGYNISRGTIILVNAWAIHRDPHIWEDASSFKPERFTKGENGGYRFIPFGTGRRQCPGSGLASKVIGLTLASFIQCFDWKRESEELVDLSEGKGVTIPKVKPLEAMCRVRKRMIHVITKL